MLDTRKTFGAAVLMQKTQIFLVRATLTWNAGSDWLLKTFLTFNIRILVRSDWLVVCAPILRKGGSAGLLETQ